MNIFMNRAFATVCLLTIFVLFVISLPIMLLLVRVSPECMVIYALGFPFLVWIDLGFFILKILQRWNDAAKKQQKGRDMN